MELKDEMILSSIVILGNFNPVIFNLGWFRRFKILPEKEIAFAEEQTTPIFKSKGEPIASESIRYIPIRCIVTPNQTQISFENYYLDLTPQRFIFLTKLPSEFERICEPVSKIFILLSHTPISALGINFEFAINLHDEKLSSEGIGKLLGCTQSIIDNGSLVNVTFRKKLETKTLNTTLTNTFEERPNHLITKYNFHYDMQKDTNEPGLDVVGKINEDFVSNLSESRKLSRNILSKLSK